MLLLALTERDKPHPQKTRVRFAPGYKGKQEKNCIVIVSIFTYVTYLVCVFMLKNDGIGSKNNNTTVFLLHVYETKTPYNVCTKIEESSI
jgi:hypothetical protein